MILVWRLAGRQLGGLVSQMTERSVTCITLQFLFSRSARCDGSPSIIISVQTGNIANNGQIMTVEFMEDLPNTPGTLPLTIAHPNQNSSSFQWNPLLGSSAYRIVGNLNNGSRTSRPSKRQTVDVAYQSASHLSTAFRMKTRGMRITILFWQCTMIDPNEEIYPELPRPVS